MSVRRNECRRALPVAAGGVGVCVCIRACLCVATSANGSSQSPPEGSRQRQSADPAASIVLYVFMFYYSALFVFACFCKFLGVTCFHILCAICVLSVMSSCVLLCCYDLFICLFYVVKCY